MKSHEYYMKQAIKEAKKAEMIDEVPNTEFPILNSETQHESYQRKAACCMWSAVGSFLSPRSAGVAHLSLVPGN